MIASMWQILGASVQGTSHLEKNTPCQDAYRSLLTGHGELILAVADGAGSAERSQEGAQLAVHQVVTYLQSALETAVPDTESDWQALIARAFSDSLESIIQLAEADNVPQNTFATTLACAVVNDAWLAVGQIGDGAVVIEDENHALFLTVPPQRGEYANEAYFLTMPDALGNLAIYTTRNPIRSLILTSDGLLRLAFKLPGYEPSPQFFQPLLTFNTGWTDAQQAQSDLIAFLNSTRVNARTDDDKTLVLATRVTASTVQAESLVGMDGTGE